jgi:hypothetical protein
MKKKTKNKSSLFLLIPIIVIAYFVLLNVLSFFIDDKNISHSKTQTWKSYYALYDWNLPTTTKGDYDQDGKEDYIGWESCAYISSVNPSLIPMKSQCNVNGGFIGFDPKQTYTGQQIGGGRLTFIVKTQDNKWRHYSYNGLFQVDITEMNEDGIFKSVNPVVLDYMDNLGYFLSHALLMYLPL